MTRIWLLMLLGALMGAAVAGLGGATVGVVAGMFVGMAWYAIRRHTRAYLPGAGVQRESHRVLCVPRGTPADCTFVRESGTGRIVDVERCSLAKDPEHLSCPKQCVSLMADAGV